MGAPDAAGQEPAGAELRREATARERGREARVGRREAHVAAQRHDESDARATAVDGRDGEFPAREQVGQRSLTYDRAGAVGGTLLEDGRVHARTEPAARARDDDRPNVGIV